MTHQWNDDAPRDDDVLRDDDGLSHDAGRSDDTEPDVLAALQSAWQGLPVPEATRELHDEDAETVRAVQWMQRAWDRLPPPMPVRPPVRRATIHRLAGWRRHLAAAAVLLAMGAALRWGLVLDRAPPTSPTLPVASDATVTTDEPSAVAEAPRLVAATDDRLELRSGSVRLVLLTTPADESTPPR